mmetsp:Transcript_23263/g.65777  ORF Transcript_23263/g.65777 Transcript_23263/m.65777 type:complete len:250 (-) Transcript_23263:9-758(-)|eukprot:CAMPEP_0177255350 /NCGR_PEP_ID=MMETSP0367-20130122/56305_1 /TAXON_ID=447022 ORGANISM="Scrippsiella hangoei-like, Strain SHHI-4" /NCGR_SAMPLE_ID=MMETSP0367 /ASSEMBLY_ACC=CAM_ASM_000362 /LENGTH=249 /DNA_ID=CAMNT_0018709049 /DNA_START=121 /DNA_END=870 /DNA_ORIENTATION=+
MWPGVWYTDFHGCLWWTPRCGILLSEDQSYPVWRRVVSRAANVDPTRMRYAQRDALAAAHLLQIFHATSAKWDLEQSALRRTHASRMKRVNTMWQEIYSLPLECDSGSQQRPQNSRIFDVIQAKHKPRIDQVLKARPGQVQRSNEPLETRQPGDPSETSSISNVSISRVETLGCRIIWNGCQQVVEVVPFAQVLNKLGASNNASFLRASEVFLSGQLAEFLHQRVLQTKNTAHMTACARCVSPPPCEAN